MTKLQEIKAWLTASLTNTITELWKTASLSFATKNEIPSVSGKADKVSGSNLNNHIAALDANGNLKDSGKTTTDFPTYATPTICQAVISELS